MVMVLATIGPRVDDIKATGASRPFVNYVLIRGVRRGRAEGRESGRINSRVSFDIWIGAAGFNGHVARPYRNFAITAVTKVDSPEYLPDEYFFFPRTGIEDRTR